MDAAVTATSVVQLDLADATREWRGRATPNDVSSIGGVDRAESARGSDRRRAPGLQIVDNLHRTSS